MTKVELQTVLKLIDLRIGVTEDSKKLKKDLKDLFSRGEGRFFTNKDGILR